MAIHTGRRLLSASTIEGLPVHNQAGEDLGEIHALARSISKTDVSRMRSFHSEGFLGAWGQNSLLPWKYSRCRLRGDFFI